MFCMWHQYLRNVHNTQTLEYKTTYKSKVVKFLFNNYNRSQYLNTYMNVWNSTLHIHMRLIISWAPSVTKCFDPLSPGHSQGGGSVVIIWASIWFSWSLFNHSQLDALSAACSSAFTAALRCLPTMHRELNVVHTDCVGKLWQPTSTGNSQVCHPCSLHRVCRSVYLAFSIHMRSGTFPPKVLSVPQWQGAL